MTSQLINRLRDCDWVPLSDGRFVKPRNVDQTLLLEKFPVDASYAWLREVKFGVDRDKQTAMPAVERASAKEKEIARARASALEILGFKNEEECNLARESLKIFSPEEMKRMNEKKRVSLQEKTEFPERAAHNPERRALRVAEQARQTPEKSSELRTRAVQIGEADAKVEAKIYLKGQYTKPSGQMFCQACDKELPFKLPSGGYYFEAVEVVHRSTKRLRETFLALCPNHAAAYQYANAQKDEMQELITAASGCEVKLELGGKPTTLYFEPVHLADIRACWSADDSSEEDAE